ncbi:MAG: hypothetical protein HY817_02205 [Candidatus Abawacabacteria bacterium]|nr:hypothetical protein [Candidatus Abawacabacteria bacterium]
MNRKYLFIAEFIFIFVGTIAIVLWDFGSDSSNSPVPSYFTEQISNGIFQHSGKQPVNGLEAAMVQEAFPNISPQDFIGVEANGGKYVVTNNTVNFLADRSKPRKSDSKGISAIGLERLLTNISKRLNQPITTANDIDAILGTLKQSEIPKAKRETTIQGEYLCLPLKDSSAKQIGCQEGIKSSDSIYYALDLAPLENIIQLMTGEKIRAEGELVLVETLSSDKWQKYPIKGIFRTVTIEEID